MSQAASPRATRRPEAGPIRGMGILPMRNTGETPVPRGLTRGARLPAAPSRALFRRRRQAGLSLIEILIALFVFMVGVLGVFAVIPVAMNQSATAIQSTRGGVLAQFAVATVGPDAKETLAAAAIPKASVTAVAAATYGTRACTRITFSLAPPPTSDDWQNAFLSVVPNTADPSTAWSAAIGQARVILHNTGTDIWVAPALNPAPDPADPSTTFALRVDRTGLSAVIHAAASALPRSGVIEDVEALYYTGNPGDGYPGGANRLKKVPDPTVDPYRCLLTNQTAISENEVSPHPWIAEIDSDAATGATSTTLATGASWTANDHVGRICVVRGLDSQVRTITGNTANTVTVSPAWDTTPAVNTNYRVLDNACYILITSGRAAGKVYHLTAVIEGTGIQYDDTSLPTAANAQNDRLVCDSGDFRKDGVRKGDSYAIIGNKTGVNSYGIMRDAATGNVLFPGNAFGQSAPAAVIWPNTPVSVAPPAQALRDPSYGNRSEYSYAVVYSDVAGVSPVSGAFAAPPVRVDVLVFRNYDSTKAPSINKKAVAVETAYLPTQ